jgi:hypothetical protein
MNILVLSSSNRNFPLDVQEAINSGGQNAIRFPALADFFSSPLRKKPYLAILEIGCPEDINRSILAFEWSLAEETPSRFLLLLSSKYLQLNEKALRFGGAEITTLPLPKKNLLFKVELQLKLLLSDKPKPPTKSQIAFQVEVELPASEKQRILKIKGPSPQEGKWNQEIKPSPSGKIRWRWVRSEISEKKEIENFLPTWTLTSDSAPIYLQEEKAWMVEDASADLVGTFEEEEVYSSKKAKEEWAKSEQQSTKEKTPTEDINKTNKQDPKNFSSSEVPKKSQIEDALAATQEAKNAEIQKTSNTHSPREQSIKPTPAKENAAEQNSKEIVGKSQEPLSQEKISKTSSPLEAKEDPKTPKISEPNQEKLTPNPQWQSKIAIEKEKPTTPGEDHRDRNIQTQQEISLQGITEEIQKTEKHNKDEIQSTLRDHRKLEFINEEEAVPKSSETVNEDAVLKSKKIDFEMNERKSREVVAEQESIESRRKKLDLFWEEDEQKPKKEVGFEEENKDVQKSEENLIPQEVSTKPKTLEEEKTEKKNEEPSNDITSEENISDSYQSVAKSYFKEKEVSKKIIVERNTKEDEGKIEVEIRGDFSKLELEKRIAPSPEKLESKVTFAADPKSGAKESDFLKYRHFEILTLAQLNDQNSTWHPVDQFRIYYSAKHRYYGIKDLTEIFPLWIYTGELAPEFIEEEKAWKFYDRSPQRFLANDPLPVPVARFLQQMAGITDQEMEAFRTGKKNLGTVTAPPSSTTVGSFSTSLSKNGEITEEKKPKQGGMLGFIKKVLGMGDT